MTTAAVALAAPASAGQQVVNADRCAAQGGVYSTSGTSRSCTVTTSGAPQDAYQLKDGAVDAATWTVAYIQVAAVTATTTTTTGRSTTTTTADPTYALVPGPVTCASGSIADVLAGTATEVDCASVGLPNSSDPIFLVAEV